MTAVQLFRAAGGRGPIAALISGIDAGESDMRKAVVAAAAAFAVASGAMTIQATAADMGFMPAPAPYVPTWQGFYIGGHIGLGEAEVEGRARVDYFDDVDSDLDQSFSFRDSLTPDGLIGGIQAGYNWQWDSLIFGIEGDVSFADWGKSSVVFDEPLHNFGVAADAIGVVSADIDILASVRGRLGMAFDNWMFYGTGGVAWADATARGKLILDYENGDSEVWSAKESFDSMGYVAGGGVSWMVVPQTFSVGLEGLYYWFDDKETLFEDSFATAEGVVEAKATAKLDDAWVVRVRGDFHF
jgi:outer membrane immunogenic protein